MITFFLHSVCRQMLAYHWMSMKHKENSAFKPLSTAALIIFHGFLQRMITSIAQPCQVPTATAEGTRLSGMGTDLAQEQTVKMD